MLVLTRGLDEGLCFYETASGRFIARVAVSGVDRGKVRLAVDAGDSVHVLRDELAISAGKPISIDRNGESFQ